MRRPKLMPDAAYPGMWRVRWPDGRVSGMTNLARAKDAVACFMERRASPARAAEPIRGSPVRQNWTLRGKAPLKNAAEADATRVSPGFFAIDRGTFRCAAVGGLNVAVAHLVLARGTGPDNRRTQWSVHSIEQRTGISRPNAAKAVKDLLDRGIWKKIRDGQHPIYEAVPGDGILILAQREMVETLDGGCVLYRLLPRSR